MKKATNPLFVHLILGLSVIVWSGGIVVAKNILNEVPPLFSRRSSLALTFHIAWTGTIGLIPFAVWESQQLGVSRLSPSAWLAIIYMGVLCSAVAFLVWNWALTRIEASQVGVYVYIEPVVTVLLASIFLSEALTWPVVIGGGVVLSGVAAVGRC